MNDYLHALATSRLALPLWALPAVWLALFVLNHLLVRAARAAHARQHATEVDDHAQLRRASQPRWLLAQLGFAAVYFGIALYAGGVVGVLFGGGLLVQLVCVCALNVQAWWSARDAALPGASTGQVRYSLRYALRTLASRNAGAALIVLALGLALPHASLLGGALLLGSAAAGYLRRARRAPAVASTDAAAPLAPSA